MRRHLLYGGYRDKSGDVLQTGASVTRARVRNGLIALLVLALAVMGVLGGQAMAYRTETRALFVSILQTECIDALSQVNSLSRTAGANSSVTLGRIRASIRVMENINRLHLNLDNRAYISDETFSELYTILDNYSSRLLTGMNTGDMQGQLQTALEALQTLILGL